MHNNRRGQDDPSDVGIDGGTDHRPGANEVRLTRRSSTTDAHLGGRVDDGVTISDGKSDHGLVGHVADNDLRPHTLGIQRGRHPSGVAGQHPDIVTRRYEGRNGVGPDEAGRSGDEDTHRHAL